MKEANTLIITFLSTPLWLRWLEPRMAIQVRNRNSVEFQMLRTSLLVYLKTSWLLDSMDLRQKWGVERQFSIQKFCIHTLSMRERLLIGSRRWKISASLRESQSTRLESIQLRQKESSTSKFLFDWIASTSLLTTLPLQMVETTSTSFVWCLTISFGTKKMGKCMYQRSHIAFSSEHSVMNCSSNYVMLYGRCGNVLGLKRWTTLYSCSSMAVLQRQGFQMNWRPSLILVMSQMTWRKCLMTFTIWIMIYTQQGRRNTDSPKTFQLSSFRNLSNGKKPTKTSIGFALYWSNVYLVNSSSKSSFQ